MCQIMFEEHAIILSKETGKDDIVPTKHITKHIRRNRAGKTELKWDRRYFPAKVLLKSGKKVFFYYYYFWKLYSVEKKKKRNSL